MPSTLREGTATVGDAVPLEGDGGTHGGKVGAAYRDFMWTGHPHQRAFVATQNASDVAMRGPSRSDAPATPDPESGHRIREAHQNEAGTSGRDHIDVMPARR